MSFLENLLEEALGQDLETSSFLGAILLWILVIPFMMLLPFMKIPPDSYYKQD